MSKPTLESKFFGCILGSALGDSIGEFGFVANFGRKITPEEFARVISIRSDIRYTDDTAMAIGIMESLVAKNGHLDIQHLGDTFAQNFEQEPWRGYAGGPPTVFAIVRNEKISYPEAAARLYGGAGSMGDGAAMRIAPLAAFFYQDKDLYEKVKLSAIVTHTHPVAIDGAAVLAAAIAFAMQLNPEEAFPLDTFIQHLIQFSQEPTIRGKMQDVQELLQKNVEPAKAAAKLKLSVRTDEAVPFAIYSFLSNPKSYTDCLYCAASNGGDTDTMAAMACAISGAYLGVESIPVELRNRLEKPELFFRLCKQLLKLMLPEKT